MQPRVKPRTTGTMEFFKSREKQETKPLRQRQLSAAPVSSNPPVKQEKEPHAIHSFTWCSSDKKQETTCTCNKRGSIQDSLMRSTGFAKMAEKNRYKELVIERDGKAISSHCPCSVIRDERLTVRYIKVPNQLEHPSENPPQSCTRSPSDEPVLFHVLTSGGENIVRIMKNPVLKNRYEEIRVYAFKGETVKKALERDGRLLDLVFSSCALFEKGTEIKTEMLNLVDDLDGKTFRIKKIDKSPPPETPPESLDDADVIQSESQRSDSHEHPGPLQQSKTTESETENATKEKPEQKYNIRYQKIPNSELLKLYLSSQVKDLVKKRKTPVSKLSNIQNLFRVEYGKNAQTCREVKTMKKLVKLSDSVCQIRIDGRAAGSGFLLFDRFVLTNCHVVKDSYNQSTGQLDQPATVHFSYECLNQEDPGVAVTEVIGLEYGADASGHMYDWALLGLSTDQALPHCQLLNNFGFLPESGAICIIGHPDGGVKKINPCLIIPVNNRLTVVEKHYNDNPEGVLLENQGHIQLLTQQFFKDVAQSVHRIKQSLTYESCFYEGSSGSPVFDQHCNVVAMHTGGYVYGNTKRERKSVIEFGHPLSSILEHLIIWLGERERFDVLRQYLSCNGGQHQGILNNVKKLVESRNCTAFKNGHETLKIFLSFFWLKEEPVPMDIDP